MTRTTFFIFALILLACGLVAGGCAGDDGEGQLAQSSPREAPRTESAPAESLDRAEQGRSEPKPEPSADSAPERIPRKQQRELLSASEKLRKKLGVVLEPRPAKRCMNIQGDPRLMRLMEPTGGCNRPPAPEPDPAAASSLDQLKPTIPK